MLKWRTPMLTNTLPMTFRETSVPSPIAATHCPAPVGTQIHNSPEMLLYLLKNATRSTQFQRSSKDLPLSAFQVRYRIDKGMPKHRSRCVACGCSRICCVENFVFLWLVLFILIQAGPIAVLVLDFLNINSHGVTISR